MSVKYMFEDFWEKIVLSGVAVVSTAWLGSMQFFARRLVKTVDGKADQAVVDDKFTAVLNAQEANLVRAIASHDDVGRRIEQYIKANDKTHNEILERFDSALKEQNRVNLRLLEKIGDLNHD